ncbi:MAG: alpha-amylase [Bacteroidales bacterium]|nr:alpha-amylase [Bacteroidales bacterium]
MNYEKKLTSFAILVLFATILFSLNSCKSWTSGDSAPPRHPEWSRNATIYEVNIRQYTAEGTFAAFEQHLPRLQKMGIKILWLMPIQPIGLEKRKGSLGSPYSIRDYYGINPDYGTLEDFKRLVTRAHELGMYLIIDWVANHTAWDNILITEHPEWYKHDSLGNIISPVADWSDVAGLDYSQPELWKYMTDALGFWVKECNIDGYRCDVAGMIPVAFWNQAVPELKKIKEVFMLAEWETPDMHDTAFDATYSWDLYHLMNQVAAGEQRVDNFDTLLKKESKMYPPDAYRMRFTTNHDENSWNGTVFERLGEGAEAFAAFTFTFPGIPLIYSGQEAALDKRLSFFEKDLIEWGDVPLGDFYSILVQLKTSHPALWSGNDGGVFLRIQTSADTAVCAFSRTLGDDRVFSIFNFSPIVQTFTLTGEDHKGAYKEVFTDKEWLFEGNNTISLEPWDYLIFH